MRFTDHLLAEHLEDVPKAHESEDERCPEKPLVLLGSFFDRTDGSLTHAQRDKSLLELTLDLS